MASSRPVTPVHLSVLRARTGLVAQTGARGVDFHAASFPEFVAAQARWCQRTPGLPEKALGTSSPKRSSPWAMGSWQVLQAARPLFARSMT